MASKGRDFFRACLSELGIEQVHNRVDHFFAIEGFRCPAIDTNISWIDPFVKLSRLELKIIIHPSDWQRRVLIHEVFRF